MRHWVSLNGFLPVKSGILWVAFPLLIALASSAWGAAAGDILKDDPKLDAPVTLTMGRVPLDAVLREAGEEIGVTLRAGKDQADWFSRELPVSVYVKEMPARDLMRRLAELADFTWVVHEADGTKSYALWQDSKARQRQLALKEEREAKHALAKEEAALSNLNAIADFSKLDDSQLKALAEKDPALAQMAGLPGFRSLGRLLGSLTPEQQQAAASPGGLRVPFRDLSPELQADARAGFGMFRDLTSKFIPNAANTEPPGPEAFENAVVVIRPREENEFDIPGLGQGITGLFNIEGANTGLRGGPEGFPLFNPHSSTGRFIGGLINLAVQNTPQNHLWINAQERIETLQSESAPQKSTDDEETRAPADTDLERAIALPMADGERTLEEALEAIHRASGLNLIADALPSENGDIPSASHLPEEETPLWLHLKELRDRHGLSYSKEGTLLTLHDDDWPLKRERLLPLSWQSRWHSQSLSADGLSLKDLMEMKVLTPAQLDYVARIPRFMGITAERYLSVLRFAAALTPEQKEQLQTKNELTLSDLSPAQQELFRDTLRLYHHRKPDFLQTMRPGGVIKKVALPGESEEAGSAPLEARENLGLQVETLHGMEDPAKSQTTFLLILKPQRVTPPISGGKAVPASQP